MSKISLLDAFRISLHIWWETAERPLYAIMRDVFHLRILMNILITNGIPYQEIINSSIYSK